MKQKITLILCTVFIMMLAACGGGKYPLNGVWSGDVYDEDVLVVFADEFCFVIMDNDVEKLSYTYEKGEGTAKLWGEQINFKVKGNSMTLTYDGEEEIFTKDTKAKAAPKNIGGVWYGPNKWYFVCVNDMLFINDEDNDLDFGKFKMNGNSGEFKCEGWLEGTFSVKGATLTVNETGYFGKEIDFSRKKN